MATDPMGAPNVTDESTQVQPEIVQSPSSMQTSVHTPEPESEQIACSHQIGGLP
jgi:hypothetical protein